MCQVTPFTYPCCNRVYVLAERLPNCPADWPRSKCPQELCIQVVDTETAEFKQSISGICWRCKAVADRKSGLERESMRPLIDKATIVEGLEELDVTERRQRVEASGSCWHCGHDCTGCEKKRASTTDPITPTPQEKKPRFGIAGVPRRRGKHERNRNMVPPPRPFRPQFQSTGYSQPFFSQSSFPAPSQYLPTASAAQGGFSNFQTNDFQINGLPLLPTTLTMPGIPESTSNNHQSGPPNPGYTNLWENFNAVQAQQPAVVGNTQAAQGNNAGHQAPDPNITLNPGGTGLPSQVTSGNIFNFDVAASYSMPDGLNNSNFNSGNLNLPQATQTQRGSTADQAINIDPDLTMEGRGQTP